MVTIPSSRSGRRAPIFLAAFLALAGLQLAAVAPSATEAQPSEQELIERVAGHLAAGARALDTGDAATAEEQFLAAVELVPEMKEAWLALAAARERGERYLEALEAAREAERLAPAEPAPLIMVGRQLARLGAVDEALETFERARDLAPRNLEAVMVPALMLRDVGRLDQSIPLLEAGLASGIDQPVLIEELALQLLADGQVEESTTLLEDALERHPDSPGLGRTFGLALAALPDRRLEALPWLEQAAAAGEDGRVDLELGTLLLESGEIERSVSILRTAVERMPDSPEAHYRLGLALQRVGEVEEARAELERFRALSRQADRSDWDERKTGTVLNEAQRAAEESRFDEALEILAELLAARPDEDRALALRAKIFFSRGELDRALDDASRAAALLPSVAEYHYLEGTALLGLDRPEEAVTALRRALAIDEGVSDVHLRLGQALLAAGRPEAAIEAFTRAEGLGAEGAGLRLSWAVALEELGRDDEADAQRRQLEER